MAKDEFSKTDQADAIALFGVARKQVLNRTPETTAINLLAKDIAKRKEGSTNALKGNLTKVRNSGNRAIANYRGKILATIKDANLKEKIRQLPFPEL